MPYRLLGHWAERQFIKHGYVKQEENAHHVTYEKYHGSWTQILTILSKYSGRHLVQSYDKKVIKLTNGKSKPYFLNECAGIEAKLLPAVFIKYKIISSKYNWRTEKQNKQNQKKKES